MHCTKKNMNSRECSRLLIVCIENGQTAQSPYMANNDLNVLYDSPLFDDLLADKASKAPFVVNGKSYNKDLSFCHSCFLHGSMLKSGFLDSRGGGGKKKQSNINVTIGSCTDSGFPSLSDVVGTIRSQNGGLKEGNTVNVGYTVQVDEEYVMKKIPASYANKLNPFSLTKANLRKLDANIHNDADYDVWLPLTLLHEVNDRMKNSLYGYFSGNMLAFLYVECDNLVMAVSNHERIGYTKETIHVEYEWEQPCCSTSLIFGHSLDDCQKAPTRVVNKMYKGKGGSFGADDECFIEVKKKKLGGNNGGNKNFKPVSVKPKTYYYLKAKQSTIGASHKTTPSVAAGGKCVLVDDDDKPLEKLDYSGIQGSEDEVETVNTKMASYLSSKPSGVGNNTKSSLEQWREIYVNDDYDPYDDDMYEGLEIPDNIQSICDNLDIKVQG
ncbi:zinc finger, CCHC-type containing protein [Tanacetum coccineum]